MKPERSFPCLQKLATEPYSNNPFQYEAVCTVRTKYEETSQRRRSNIKLLRVITRSFR
jgi:hypothetical protein